MNTFNQEVQKSLLNIRKVLLFCHKSFNRSIKLECLSYNFLAISSISGRTCSLSDFNIFLSSFEICISPSYAYSIFCYFPLLYRQFPFELMSNLLDKN